MQFGPCKSLYVLVVGPWDSPVDCAILDEFDGHQLFGLPVLCKLDSEDSRAALVVQVRR